MPGTEDHSAIVIELAEEFVERYRRGERPPLSEYTDRHPDFADEIREVFPAMALMENIALDDEAGPQARPATGCAPRPERLGEFRILREVGRGGMGVVYEAEQESLGRRVALKVLPKGMLIDPKQKKRFQREAKAAAKLHHTNIVPVFGVGEQEGMDYYAMQFIHGQSLDEVLKELKRLAPVKPRPWVASPDDQHAAPVDPQPAPPHSPLPPGEGPGVRASLAQTEHASAADLALSLHTGEFQRTMIVDSQSATPLSREPSASAPPLDPRRSTLDPPADTATARLSETISLSGSAVLPGQSEHDATSPGKSTYWQSVARIGIQAGEALQHAHQHGILHRDVKPSNLLLDTTGTVWVTDFGLAKAEDQQNLTATGDVIGTLRYMAPELFEGKADEKSDVYSLGLTLYELLALRPAFDETDRHQLIRQVLHDSPPRLRTLNPSIPRDLETIVHKAIDRDPSHRYGSAEDLAEDLQRYLHDEPIQARRISPLLRLQRWCKRNPMVAGMTATIALLLLTAVVASSLAATRFRDLAGRNARLADEKQTALDEAIQARNQARREQGKAEKARKQAVDAREEVEGQRKRLAANVDLALQALEEVYLQFAEQRLTEESALDDADRRFLEKMLPFYESFAGEKGDDEQTRIALAEAAVRVGTIQRRLKEHGSAEASLRRAENLWRKLAEAAPDDRDRQAQHAAARKELGVVFLNAGKLDEAEAVLRPTIEEYEKLVRDSPEHDWQSRQLAFCRHELGVVLSRKDRDEEAEKLYNQAITDLKQLVAAEPNNSTYRQDLAHALSLLADLKGGGEKAIAAKATFEDFLSRYESLASEEPDREDFALALASGRRTLAGILQDAGRQSEAEQTYRDEIQQRRRLVKMAPHDPSQKYELAYALYELGMLLRRVGRHGESKTCHEEAAGIMDSVTEWWPENRKYQRFRVNCLYWLGERCYVLGETGEAHKHLSRALELLNVWGDASSSVNPRSHYLLAMLAADAEQFAAAEEHFRESVRRQIITNERNPVNWNIRNLFIHQRAFADFLVQQQRFDEAIEAYHKVIEFAEDYVNRFGERQQDVGRARWKLGQMLSRKGRQAQAIEQYRLALDDPTPSIDYRVRISTPGVYRLYLHASGHSRNADSCVIRIVEILDGPGGPAPDWYTLPFLAQAGHDLERFQWKRRQFDFEYGKFDVGHEPAIWTIDQPGDYTIRVIMREDGFALDALALQLVSLPGPTETPSPPSKMIAEGIHLEQDGRVIIEAENFASRKASPNGHNFVVIPDENAGIGWRSNARGNKYVQALPDNTANGGSNRIPGERLFPKIYRQRIALFEELLKENPDDEALQDDIISLHHPLGRQLWLEGNYDEAIRMIEKSFQLQERLYGASSNPTNLEFTNTVEKLALEPSDAKPQHYEPLCEWAKKAVQNSPTYAFHHDMLALALFRAGRFEEAIRQHRVALSVGRGLPRATANIAARLAWCYAEVGNVDLGRRWLEFAVQYAAANSALGRDDFSHFRDGAKTALGLKSHDVRYVEPGGLTGTFDLLVDIDPDIGWAYLRRAELHATEGRLDDAEADRRLAIEAFGRLIAELPESFKADIVALHLERGKLLWKLEEHAAACDVFSHVIELAPENHHGWNLRGIVHNRLGKHEQAIADYSKAIELKPEGPVLWANRAYTYYRYLRRYKEAAADWTKALELRPGEKRWWLRLADSHYYLGRWEKAAQWYTRRLEDNPDGKRALSRRGVCFRNLGRWDEALADFAKWAELDPDNIVPLQERTRTFEKMGEPDLALQEYGRRIALSPGTVFTNVLDTELARNTRYLQRFPEDANAWEQRGHLYSFRRENDWGEVPFTQAIRLRPDVARYLNARARWYLRSDRLDEAAADVLEVIRLEPSEYSVLSAIVETCAKQGDYQRAADVLAKAVDLGADSFRPYYELALIQYAEGDLGGYRQTCRKMVARCRGTDDPLAAGFVAWTCALAPGAIDEYASAIALGRNAVAAADDPLKAIHKNSLAATLFRAGRYVEALDLLQEVAETFADATVPENQTSAAYTRYLLAMTFARLGLPEQAAQWLAQANEAAEEELSLASETSEDGSRGQVLWNRRLTLELLRSEAEAAHAAGADLDSPVVLRERAVWFARQSDSEIALPQTAEEWDAVGTVVRDQKRWPETAAAFTEATRLMPDEFLYHHRRAEALNHQGHSDQAIAEFGEAIRRKPDSVWSHWGRGKAKHRKKDWEGALTDIHKAIELDPHADFYRYRARALRALGRYEEAVAAYSEAIRLDPDDAANYVDRAEVLAVMADADLEQTRWPEIAGALSEALERLPPDPSWGSPRKRLCAQIAQWDEVFEKLSQQRPDDHDLWIGRGRFHLLHNHFEQAVKDYARVIDEKSTLGEWFEYAGLLVLTGDLDGYREVCQRVVAQHGETDDPLSAHRLARLCGLTAQRIVEPSRLVKWAESAVATQSNPWYLHALGLAHFRAGQYDQAIRRLEKSNSMGWGSGIAAVQNWLVLAMAYHHLGAEPKARDWLAKAEAAIEQARPFTPEDPFVTPPPDWPEIHVLRREAEALLGIGTPTTTDQSEKDADRGLVLGNEARPSKD